MKNRLVTSLLFIAVILLVCFSCSKLSVPASVFRKQSPHDAYGQRLKDAGLDRNAIGHKWLLAADESLAGALSVTVPYKETGYFGAENAQTSVLSFNARQGEKIHISLTMKPAGFKIFVDLFQPAGAGQFKSLAFADTAALKLDFQINKSGKYLVRLQPELLQSGEYTLTITSGPSLAFPVSSSGKPHVESFFGDTRDEGGRRHEGIDIFAPKGTPALAAAKGIVTGVSENKLGGLVVFLRPDDEDYTLYYAHLEVQLVHEGQQVNAGDTVGLIDNTGNAKNTPTHLHFGIYTGNGAVDPLPFVNRKLTEPHKIDASTALLNVVARTAAAGRLYASPDKKTAVYTTIPLHTAITVNAASDDWYRITLPGGQTGFINSNSVERLGLLRSLTLKVAEPVYDAPDSASASRKTILNGGEKANILAVYKNYYLVSANGQNGWISPTDH